MNFRTFFSCWSMVWCFLCAHSNYFFASFHCNGVYWISLHSCKNNELEYAKFFGSPDDSQCRLFTLLYYVSNVYDTSYAGQENLHSHEKQRNTTDRPCALTKYIIYKYYSEKGCSQIIEHFPPFIWIFYGFSMFFFHVFVFRFFAVHSCCCCCFHCISILRWKHFLVEFIVLILVIPSLN